jgi:cytochrome c oxidase subunit II
MRWMAAGAGLALLVGACGGVQSAVDPAGPQAERVATLWWVWLAVATVVWLAVVVALALALRRGMRAERVASREDERGVVRAVVGGVGLTVVVLFALLADSVLTERALARLPAEDPLRLEIVGRQWWWEITYGGGPLEKRVTTANEIHLPAGRTVHATLASRDVIHSFWVPNLHGKVDLIPGLETRIELRADRPGTYRGQCAEFCGVQHAHMAFLVVVEPEDEFDAWLEAQRRPAAEPSDTLARRGREVFLGTSCVVCHTVRGTEAFGRTGPDLTHFASRRTIAAATRPNRRGHLAGWIANPHGIKPGSHMPRNLLAPDDLHALLAYLEALE